MGPQWAVESPEAAEMKFHALWRGPLCQRTQRMTLVKGKTEEKAVLVCCLVVAKLSAGDYRLNVFPRNSHVEALSPDVMGFGGGGFDR